MRITVDLTDGSKVVAEPTLADLKAVGPDVTTRLTNIDDPLQSMLAAATLAHAALRAKDTPNVPEALDDFLAQCQVEPPGLDDFGADGPGQETTAVDPTGGASAP